MHDAIRWHVHPLGGGRTGARPAYLRGEVLHGDDRGFVADSGLDAVAQYGL
ncbi:hypothetical protein [Blastococcus capsensis]|uniref:hypothetical protein n=1 Tax=Blastococcus capsensis TaxID=1564163 RepID=UPI0025415F5A|nr:hypothetical protein [Blastococcus capsensis]MDK3256830.1 hypothetical protein [Blastococcus capsensis]